MNETAKIRMHSSHPGQFIRDEILDARRLSVGDAAAQLGVPARALLDLLTGKAALSPELAERIDAVFGTSKETLLIEDMRVQWRGLDTRIESI